MARRGTAPEEPHVEQVIRLGECYSLTEGLRRLGWGRDAFDSAKRQGLKTIKRCGRVYLSGSDIIAFLTGKAEDAAEPS